MRDLKEAEKAIIDFGDLIPAAEKVIEAHKLLVLNHVYALRRKAKEDNEPYLVLPKEQCDKIRAALFPHVFANIDLSKKGYDHFIVKDIPLFEEGDLLPTLEEMRVDKK